MIRALAIFFLIFFLAIGGVWLADHPGVLVIEWLEMRIDTSVALAVGVLGVVLFILFILMRLLGGMVRSASEAASYFAGRRARQRQRSLSEGLLHLAAGDIPAAQRCVSAIRELEPDHGRSLPDPLILLLRGETAYRAEHNDLADAVYQSMLSQPETELLGLMGLADVARREGSNEEALEFAQRAFRLAPGNTRAFHTYFSLLTAEANWPEARRAVEAALRTRLMSDGEAARRMGLLLTAQATVAREEGRTHVALTLAQRALGLDPDCLPAALLAADCLRQSGRKGRAAAVIETMWARRPHPRLGEIYANLTPREGPLERWKRVVNLIETNQEHPESRLMFARHAIEAGKYDTARDALKALTSRRLTPRAALLMAEAELGAGADRDVSDHWLKAGAMAERDGLWQCHNCGQDTDDWALLCPNCGQFNGLVWQTAGADEPDPELVLEAKTAVTAQPDSSLRDEAEGGTAQGPAKPERVHVASGPAARDGSAARKEDVPQPAAPKPEPEARDLPEHGSPSPGSLSNGSPSNGASGNTPDQAFMPPRPPDDPGPPPEKDTSNRWG